MYACIPPGNTLGPVLYLWYTVAIATIKNTVLGKFADDTIRMATGAVKKIATVDYRFR